MTTLADGRSDAALVEGYLAGDGDALGALYDRYHAGLYDTAAAMLRDRHGAADVVQEVFCVAAVKLGQLRDANRVKPWLYAVARHEIYRRTKKRGRERASIDALIDERGEEPVAAPDPAAEASGAISAELATLVRDAAAGLEENDQLVLELSARQGLVGADLAAAMGISVSQAHTLVHRMRDRLERAIGAVVVTRGNRSRCPELADVLAGWDGRLDALWRKRISRHIDRCEECQATRRGAAVLSLAGAAPAFAAPFTLRPQTLDAAAAAANRAGDDGAGRDGGHGGDGGDGGDSGDDGGTRVDLRFDRQGFPTAGAGRTAIGPLAVTVATAGSIAVAMIVLAMVTSGIGGSVSPGLAPGAPPIDSTVDSSAPDSTPATSEPASTEPAITTAATTSAATTNPTAPNAPPGGPPQADPPTGTTPSRDPQQPTRPTGGTSPPVRETTPPTVARTTGVLVAVTTTTTNPPILVIRTTTTQPTFGAVIPPTTQPRPPR